MLTIEIVTPERIVHKLHGVEVLIPTVDGQIGVRKGHIPLITILKAGEVIVKHASHADASYAVSGGFVEVLGNVVRILADSADRSEELSEAKIKAAIERAETMKLEATEKGEFDAAVALLEANIVRMKILSKRNRGR